MATSPPPGVFAKGTHYRLTYFSYVQRAYTRYYTRQNLQVNSWESQSVEVDQRLLIFSLQMILFYFAKPTQMMLLRSKIFSMSMKVHRVSKLIGKRLPSSLVSPHLKLYKKISKLCLVLLQSSNTRDIWAFPPSLVGQSTPLLPKLKKGYGVN